MSDKVIVTIDREFGSGGHEVARRLAERRSNINKGNGRGI